MTRPDRTAQGVPEFRIAPHVRWTYVKHKLLSLMPSQPMSWPQHSADPQEVKLLTHERCYHRSRLAKPWAVRWRRMTREAGPARTKALRHVRQAELRAYDHIATRREGGSITRYEAALDTEAVERGVRLWWDAERLRYPHRGSDAYLEWRHLALLTRWRVRAALRQRYWHVYTSMKWGQKWHERVRRDEGACSLGAGRACPRASAMYTVACCSAVKPLHMLIPQIEGRRAALFSIGCPGLIRFEQAAASHWLAGGGWPGELARRKEGKVEAARRALLRLGAQFAGFMRQDGVAMRGISGAPISVGGEEVH